jgi:hypothetical protein
MEPGTVPVCTPVSPRGSAMSALGLNETCDVEMAPVPRDGVVTPSPFRKIVTVDPDSAGFEQLFALPS